MATLLPLLSHRAPQDVVAWRDGAPISAARFIADARAVSARFPAGRHVLNACTDRYRFAVGFAAGLLSGRTSLLPPTHVPEVIRHLRQFAPDAFCLTDDADCSIELPRLPYPELADDVPAGYDVPHIDGQHLAAQVFTSGSTGVPVPHAKRWGDLLQDVAVEADRLAFHDGRHWALLATVPPQHMYGFESSLLVALCSGQSFAAGRPFYPADIVAQLAALPRPRVLVSTPVHLRALLAANLALPTVDAVLCATAPLDDALARDVEALLQAPLLEIYGSTETGQIASRQTTRDPAWELWPDVRLQQRDGRTWAEGGHVRAPTPLGDVLELLDERHFLLRGRNEDMINIAGKRSSLAYLNHQLLAIPGVVDGVFYLPEAAEQARSATGALRLGALVVAPGMTADAIRAALRERIDAVFLPRPLHLVASLPRNSTGKLTRATLRQLTGHSP